MKGILTITVKDDSNVQQIIDRLTIELKLAKIVPLPNNTIMQDDPKYTLQFSTNLDQQQLLSKIKNYPKTKGLNIICQILDKEDASSQVSKPNKLSDYSEEQYSKKIKAHQKASIISQLQFLQNSQDSEQEHACLESQNKKQDEKIKNVSEIKSQDQFQILQEVISIKSSQSEIKIQTEDKKQLNCGEAPNTSKLQLYKSKSKQENTEMQPKQKKQILQISEKQLANQQGQPPNDDQQESIDQFFKYSRGKDDYSTVFKIQPQDNTQQHIAQIIKEHQPNSVQEKSQTFDVFPQKQNSQCFFHKSTASCLESSSVDVSVTNEVQKQKVIQVVSQPIQQIKQQVCFKPTQELIQVKKQQSTTKIEIPDIYIDQEKFNFLEKSPLIQEKIKTLAPRSQPQIISQCEQNQPLTFKFGRNSLIIGTILAILVFLYLIF